MKIPTGGANTCLPRTVRLTLVVLAIAAAIGVPSARIAAEDNKQVVHLYFADAAKPFLIVEQRVMVHPGSPTRFGRQIVWSDRDRAVAASDPTSTEGPATIDWDAVARIGREEGMVPGYSIFPPATSSQGGSALGAVTLVNHWPQRLDEQRTVFLDRFSGRTLGETTAADSGILARATDFGVNMHMGTQYGVVTRVAATLGCLLVVASLVTSYAMWWRRRPTGTAGLPRTSARRDTTRTRGSRNAPRLSSRNTGWL